MTSSRTVAGALYDFLGYLTSLEKPIRLGSSCNANPAINALKQWAKERDFNIEDADVQTWQGDITPRCWSCGSNNAKLVSTEEYVKEYECKRCHRRFLDPILPTPVDREAFQRTEEPSDG